MPLVTYILGFLLVTTTGSLRSADAFPVVALRSDNRKCVCASQAKPQAESNDLLLFIEEIHMNNTVAIICSKMQNLKQIFQ